MRVPIELHGSSPDLARRSPVVRVQLAGLVSLEAEPDTSDYSAERLALIDTGAHLNFIDPSLLDDRRTPYFGPFRYASSTTVEKTHVHYGALAFRQNDRVQIMKVPLIVGKTGMNTEIPITIGMGILQICRLHIDCGRQENFLEIRSGTIGTPPVG